MADVALAEGPPEPPGLAAEAPEAEDAPDEDLGAVGFLLVFGLAFGLALAPAIF